MEDISLDIINDINSSSKEWTIIHRCFRDIGRTRAKFLEARAKLGYPHHDYVRLRTLGLCAEEIYKNGVEGDVAEAGVFRGFFSSALSELFSDRMLYLYDTFAGFDERDIEAESSPDETRNKSWYVHINKMSSSVDLIADIKSRLPHPEKAIFRKGYFPDSAVDDVNRKFCFVSLDMDIYKPTLAGLEFFWPKMISGGYIFLHDGKFDGVQRAISAFRQEKGIPVVPICDPVETYILCKP